jgi:hypothetical protein
MKNLSRRSIISMAAVAPLSSWLISPTEVAEASSTVEGRLNVLIHGLLFMRMVDRESTPKVQLVAPRISGHKFIGGAPGNLQVLSGDIKLLDGLRGMSPTWKGSDKTKIPLDIKPSILQFLSTETLTGNLKTDVQSAFGTVLLPWPQEFFSLRCDGFSKYFESNPSTVVGKNIKAHCNNGATDIGVVTCLQYKCDFATPPLPGWIPTTNMHFYMLSSKGHDITTVNAALAEAANIFDGGTNPFDFRIVAMPSTPVPTPIGQDCSNVIGISALDELSLDEWPSGWQHGMSDLVSRKQTDLHDTTKATQPRSSAVAKVNPVDANLNPANCPNFYVGP